MIRRIPFLIRISLLSLLSGLFVLSCTSMRENTRNFEEDLPASRIGIIKQRGYRFWIYDGPRDPVDELWLVPGQYMIGFENSTGRSGVGLCGIDPGFFYGLSVTGREYLPRAGIYALKGYCTQEYELTDEYLLEWKMAHSDDAD